MMVLQNSDIISLHIPGSDGYLIGKHELKMMKSGSYIINVARGGVVDEEALLSQLDEGHIAGAALDVYEGEPKINPALLKHRKVSLTPHIGASTNEAQERVGDEVVDIILNFRQQ